ncbi:hypothetical protein K1T71_013361 [Dendrolimus kikuchii]|uniref:Uncharacterized protein n=1 Tax=Dendrolimus kikuchii TaxID=765133 RepID=A0ACC1CI59_9NEOP|nr:hypothetical protein K1T71_013361 [Dendrolimus kikuchii]
MGYERKCSEGPSNTDSNKFDISQCSGVVSERVSGFEQDFHIYVVFNHQNQDNTMALATATATMESSQTRIQTESRIQHSYQEVQVTEQRQVKKKTKSSRRHKDEGNISVSKSSEKLFKKMKAASNGESNPRCEKCSRPVYVMERIKAERRVSQSSDGVPLMADPEPRPPRGASAVRKRSRVRSRGPYPDLPNADESAIKVHAPRRSRSTAGRGRGAVRAVSVGAPPGAHSQDEPAGVIPGEALNIGATPEATLAGAKGDAVTKTAASNGAAKKKGAAAKVRPQDEPAGSTPAAAVDKDAALQAHPQDMTAGSSVDAAVSGRATPVSEPVDVLTRGQAICDQIDQILASRRKDSVASEPAEDPVDPREGDIERMGAEELRALAGSHVADIFHVAQTSATPKKHQMIICESNPVELPPDVVRASDKPDLGLEELASLDVKSRFEVFERRAAGAEEPPPPTEPRQPREKSAALLSKLAKFKAKGMDIGVSDEYLNGVQIEESASEPEDEEDEDSVLRKSYKHTANKEQPVSFCNMSEILGKFESGQHTANNERHRERKQEIQNIRSRLFMGKQAKIKEMYEQSVLQSEQAVTSAEKIAKELDLDTEKARSIKQRFENGEVFNDENQPPRNREIEDRALFNEGIAKKSRSIFLELDANAKNMSPTSPPPNEVPKRKEMSFVPKDVVRAADKVEDVKIETSDISDRFRFFETYKPESKRKEFRMTPPRQPQRPKSPSPEVYHEPSVVRSEDKVVDTGLAANRHTASRMISVFRQMEEQHHQPEEPVGPKPLKRFTPPPPGEANRHTGETSSEEEEYSSEEYEEDSEEERRRLYLEARQTDEALKQAQQLARTKSFRDRFEHWKEEQPQRSPSTIQIEREQQDDEGESQLETAKSLRQKFENMKVQTTTVSKTLAAKVNRFV